MGVNWVCVTDDLLFPIVGVKQLVADPDNPNYIIAILGTTSGLQEVQNNYMISEDGGDSWVLGFSPPDIGLELGQINFVFFHPSINNLVFAVTDKMVLLSTDNGNSWTTMSIPDDIDYTFSSFSQIVALGSEIYLTNTKIYGGLSSMWKGALTTSGIGYNINWGNDIASTLIDKTLSDLNPITDPNIFSTYIENHVDYYDHSNLGPHCVNHTINDGNFARIKTEGWNIESIGGIDRLTGRYQNNYNNTQVIAYRLNGLRENFNYSNNKFIELQYSIPAGVKLKICWSDYTHVQDPNYFDFSVCTLEQYDYGTLFQNVIYETDFYTSNTSIHEWTEFVLDDPTLFNQTNNYQHFLYFILEFDASYDYVNTPKFELQTMDFFYNEQNPEFIKFSNVVNNQFYCLVKNQGSSNNYNYYLQQENLPIQNVSIGTDDIGRAGGLGRCELIQSINNTNQIYQANLDEPISSPGTAFIDMSGHHDDYRSSTIVSVNIGGIDQDYIFWGNDGGIAYTPNALGAAPGLISLNGDLSINLLYSLDVHDKSKKIAIGQQDNWGLTYIPSIGTSIENGAGENSIPLIQENQSNYIVGGDPQLPGAGAMRDFPVDALGIVADMSDVILSGEPFLGMRLESYKYYPDKFVSGLRSVPDAPGGKVIINNSANNTVKLPVEFSSTIGAIGICQNNPLIIYAAEKEPSSGGYKFFKTINEGVEWQEWNPMVVHQNGSTQLSTILDYNFINALVVDFDNANVVYAGIAGVGKDANGDVLNSYLRVIKSTNGGLTFADWSEGLSALPINQMITIDSKNHLIFCATDAGVYYRMDGMSQWECFSTNLPLSRITDLDFNYCSKELYCSTYGRGVWKTPVTFNLETDDEQVVSQNETWGTPVSMKKNLRILSGKTLVINSTVHMDVDRKIIIEAGARLILDGAIITNDCGNYWSGIEVWGNSAQYPNGLNQGSLNMLNNAIIEYAKVAVQTWKPGDLTKTGGIVQAVNSTFRNNMRSISYYPYNYYSPTTGNEILNTGRFTNCEFLWDNNYIGTTVYSAVKMNHVNGVRFAGCDFIDSRSDVPSLFNRPIGIFSIDAGYKVHGRNIGPLNSPIHTEYSETNYDVGYFKNLRKGVYAMNANTPYSISVDHCKFEDITTGIHISSVDNALLTRNKFDYTSSNPFLSGFTGMHQMVINKSTGFTIEGNIFDSQIINPNIEGVLVFNSGMEPNRVFRNDFNKMYTGNYASGQNSNDNGGIDQPSGLQFLCNDYTNAQKYDEYVRAGPFSIGNGQGIRVKQGTSTTPAGNKFSTLAPGLGNAHIKSEDFDNIIYYHAIATNEIPTLLIGNVGNQTSINPDSECGSTFNTLIAINGATILNNTNQLQLINELQAVNSDYIIKANDLNNLLIVHDPLSLHTLVANLAPNNKQMVKTQLENHSPYLSVELLKELGDKTPGIFPHAWYMDIIALNIEVAQNKSFMTYLLNKTVPLPSGLLNQVNNLSMTTTTSRGVKMDEITDLTSRKTIILDLLIQNELSDSVEVNWQSYKNWIEQRDDIICKSQLADMYLGKREVIQCNEKLDDIDVHINEYMIDEIKQEMVDYSLFKKYIITIADSNGIVETLSENQILQLEYMALNFVGKASVQARNLLCFHAGLCEEIEVVYAQSNKSEQASEKSDELYISNSSNDLKVIPNPNNGEFKLIVPETCSIQNLQIFDIRGENIVFESITNDENEMRISIKNTATGIYILKANCSDNTTLVSRILVK